MICNNSKSYATITKETNRGGIDYLQQKFFKILDQTLGVDSYNFVYVGLAAVNDLETTTPETFQNLTFKEMFNELITVDIINSTADKPLIVFLDDSVTIDTLLDLHNHIQHYFSDIRNVIAIHNGYGSSKKWETYCELNRLESFCVAEFLMDMGSLTICDAIVNSDVFQLQKKSKFDYVAVAQFGKPTVERVIIKLLSNIMYPGNPRLLVEFFHTEFGANITSEMYNLLERITFFKRADLVQRLMEELNSKNFDSVYSQEEFNQHYVKRTFSSNIEDDHHFNSTVLFSLCRESNYNNNTDLPRITEKTVRALVNLQPIVYLSSLEDTYEMSKSLGIEFFEDLFDYSFDSDKYFITRAIDSLANLEKYINLTDQELSDIFDDCYPRLEANFNLVKSGKLMENIFDKFTISLTQAINKSTARTEELEKSFNRIKL